jgi:raffinose/stachyose/melibiose transport system permease protein
LKNLDVLTEQRAAAPNLSTKKKPLLAKLKSSIPGYLFVLPLLIIFAIFFVYSFYFLIKISFQDANLSFVNSQFVGLENYKILLQDMRFFKSIFNNTVFSGFAIFISITFGFAIAIFLSFKFRGVKLLQTLFFLPTLMPMALVATVFSVMLEAKFGTLNTFLHSIGLGFLAQNWLSDPGFAYFSVMFVSIYLIGIPIMYYTAELTTIDPSIFEAATIDGAGLWRIMTFILYPLLQNSHKTIIVSMLLASFREFERVLLMTDSGPAGVTEISSTYIYSFAKQGMEMGYVAAASVLVLIIGFIIAFVQLQIYRKVK